MNAIRIVSYKQDGVIRPGIAVGHRVHAPAALGGRPYASVQAMLDDWDTVAALLADLAAVPLAGGVPLDTLHLVAPVPAPRAIYCAGANYRDHVANMFRVQNIPPEPDPKTLGLGAWHFMKSAHCVVGSDAVVSKRSAKLDWEAELAAVIGRGGKDIAVEAALSHVAGYMNANDLSARDNFFRDGIGATSPFKYDWIGHKNFDGSCPLGPWLVPAAAVGDPQALSIRLWVNDRLCQDSTTGEMIFTVAEQIAQLSKSMTLHPGDVVLTGTPAGTGTERGERLEPGDTTRVAIEGLGELVTRFA